MAVTAKDILGGRPVHGHALGKAPGSSPWSVISRQERRGWLREKNNWLVSSYLSS